MLKGFWIWFSVGALSLPACGQDPSVKEPPTDASTTKAPPAAFEKCLQDNGWAVPDDGGGSLSNRDLAARIAAVKLRCQPSDEDLEQYVRKLIGES